MAQSKRTEDADAATAGETATAESTTTTNKQRPIPAGFRQMFSEVGRLSATLGVARTAVYDGDAAKIVKALKLLEKQLPLAVEAAELMVPSSAE